MLIGEYLQKIGDKNRVAIPKKLRVNLKGETFLSKGFDYSLILFDQERLDFVINEINRSPLLSLTSRELKRYVLGSTFQIEPDSQGRFVIPEELRSFSGMNEEIVFIGVGEWIELWDRDKWSEKSKELSSSINDLSELLYRKMNSDGE